MRRWKGVKIRAEVVVWKHEVEKKKYDEVDDVKAWNGEGVRQAGEEDCDRESS